MSSLGFQTLVVNNRSYDNHSLTRLYDLFIPLGISNFVFLSDFDFTKDSFAIKASRIKSFKLEQKPCLPRRTHVDVFYHLILNEGCAFNPDFARLYTNKKYRSLFCSYPIFLKGVRHDLAKDINQMLYRAHSFVIFTNFEAVIETSVPEAYQKLFDIPNIGFGFELTYLFRADKQPLLRKLLDKGVLIIPMISHDVSNYVGIMNDAKYFMETFGKNVYNKLCLQLSRGCTKFGY